MSNEDAYSPFKAVRHLDVVQGVRRGVPVRPVHVQIILSDLCNHSCDFCAYRDPDYTSSTMFYEVDEKNLKKGLRKDAAHPERNYNPNRMIPLPKVQEILDDCAEMGVAGIQFTGGGEPTVHPAWLEAIAYAQQQGLATSLVTNGVNLVPSIVVANCAWVRVSVDAGDAESYKRIRHCPASHFDKVWANITALRDARIEHRSKVVIGVGYVVTPDNWRGILSGARLAKAAGADNIRISAQFSAQDEHLFAGFHEEASALAREAEALSDGSFKVFNRFGEKLADLHQHAPSQKLCGYQSFTTYIGADLNLYRCCVYAYHPTGLYGSIKESRFKDEWMRAQRAEEMAAFDARGCARCQFGKINSFLDYMLRPDDQAHSEFV